MLYNESSRSFSSGMIRSESPPASVAVIGAGVSGAICANRLASSGWVVTVFEKGRGPGGRMATRREGERAIDHGAQYFTARDPRFRSLVADMVERGVVAEWGGRWAVLRHGTATTVPDEPRYVGVPGMSAVARDLLTGIACRHATEVAAVRRVADCWSVLSADGTCLGTFDYLVITAPEAQARRLVGDQVPLFAGVPVREMVPAWIAAVTVPTPLDAPFDQAIVADSPVASAARSGSKPGRDAWSDTWVLHGSSEWSARHLEWSPRDVGPALLQAFAEALGHRRIDAEVLFAHRWRYARPVRGAAHGPLFDAVRGVGCCGDWLAQPRVESAALSGWDLADRMLAHHAALVGGAV